MNLPLQELLFERIFNQFSKRSDAVNKIADTLNASRDSVYRRVRGTTLLTPDELQTLAMRFKISLDALIYQEHNIVLFQFRPQNKQISSFDEFLKSILKDMGRMYDAPNHQMYYATTELPLFYFLAIPELRTLKMYFWGRMVWELKYLEERQFTFDVIPQTAHLLANEITRLYMNMPSKEVWSINIFDNTINQIKYLISIGAFKNLNDALVVCDKMLEFVELLKLMASRGKKGTSKSIIELSKVDFDLYHNEILHTNNIVLAVSDEGKVVFTSFANPNFIKSIDQKFATNTEGWFGKLIARSTSISINTERQREWYFNVLQTKINTLRNRVELAISEQNIMLM